MKIDKNDINSQLSLLAIGIILLTLGIYSKRNISFESFTIFNIIEIVCIGIGVLLIIYPLINIVRITKKQR